MWIQIETEEAEEIALHAKSRKMSDLEERILRQVEQRKLAAAFSARYIKEARGAFGREGELEFDDDAVVSRGADDGAYVMAWRWVERIPPSDVAPHGTGRDGSQKRMRKK